MFWIIFFAFIGISITICSLIIAGVRITESQYFDEHSFEFYCIVYIVFVSLTLTIILGKPIAKKIFEKEMQSGDSYTQEILSNEKQELLK